MPLATIPEAITDFQNGRFVIIVDDEDRENEGDLVIAAEFATPETINFMAKEGRGLICIAMRPERLDQLNIPLMVPSSRNKSGFGTNFTISIEARHDVTTGISAQDRAQTIATLIDAQTTQQDIAMPGHMFPLRAHPNGVFGRRGQTEASVDLARLAGLYPAGVICEIMAEDGTMQRLPDLVQFAAEHEIKIISVEQLVAYRHIHPILPSAHQIIPSLIESTHSVKIPTTFGIFDATVYIDDQQQEHLLLSMNETTNQPTHPLVRIHSECITGDLFSSYRCDCGEQLQTALQQIATEQSGYLIYLRQEGRGIGLANKMRAYALQDQGLDTVEANLELGLAADARQYDLAINIIQKAGLNTVRLLTNNPEKVDALRQAGIEVFQTPLEIKARSENQQYLKTKAEKMGHLFHQSL